MAEMTANAEMEDIVQSLVGPAVAPEIEGVIAEGDVSASPVPMKEVGEVDPVPCPSPLVHAPGSPASQPPGNASTAEVSGTATSATEAITITDQDVLFGRGGLTNRHVGNLRYRDMIGIHRQDYVRAQKTEKPHVARRIVAAIRTGTSPGRFLKRGKHGTWVAVSDQEAAWKASQALREKSRWSSMKREKNPPPASPAAADTTADATTETPEESKKRPAPAAGGGDGATAAEADGKHIKREAFPPFALPPELKRLLGAVPSELRQIAIPPVVNAGGAKQVGANYMLPATMNTNSKNIFPKDEDVLFGRGGRTNHHPGNKRLRQIVNKYRDTYQRAKKLDKPNVSKLIVSALRRAVPPSRFLRMNEDMALWEDVGDKRAAEKVSQRLREKARGDEERPTTIRETPSGPAATATREASENATSVAATHAACQKAADETQRAKAEDTGTRNGPRTSAILC